MRPRDRARGKEILSKLASYEAKFGELPGIASSDARETFVEQLLESFHRIDYVRRLKDRPISPLRKDPSSGLYDPLKAALLFEAAGAFDEACWQVFLSVHFGRDLKAGWRLPKDVYGRLGGSKRWGWKEVSANVDAFKDWLREKEATLRGGDGVTRRFSNHRKYQSLNADSNAGTGAAVQSYVYWVTEAGGHAQLFKSAIDTAEHDPRLAFAILYEQMRAVISFGRVAKFDYLTMIGKLGLADIEPNIAYINGSTGPIKGARLLFDEMSGAVLDQKVLALGDYIGANMQAMEDSLCNWQKSTNVFVRFRG